MNRLMIAAAMLAAVPASSFADPYRAPPRSAGARGTITAWNASGTRVIEHRFCTKSHSSWDYSSCGARVRDDVRDKLCAHLGSGTHRYLYQVGDAKPNASTVYCKR